MSPLEQNFNSEIHPIDLCESLAHQQKWKFDRITDDQISLSIEGRWRNYAITIAWSTSEEMLQLICTFEMETPSERLPQIYEILNHANDQQWAGAFTYWEDQRLIVYRYGLFMSADNIIDLKQTTRLIETAITASENYFPAFQLVAWAEEEPENALKATIKKTYGRA